MHELMTHDFVMAFVRVAHSAGQSHVLLFVNLLNEIVSEEPSAPQKRWWFFNIVVAFVRVAHSVRQCHGLLFINLLNEIVSEEPPAPQKHWWNLHVIHSMR